MHTCLPDLLQCPACGGALGWAITRQTDERLLDGAAACVACGAVYPLHEGIGLFLTPDLPRDDLWEQAASGLTRYVEGDPDVASRLLDSPLESLNPADQMFRAMVLEDRGDISAARYAAEAAWPGVYTAAYRAAVEQQYAFVLAALAADSGPVVDLASGRGGLVERLARSLDRPIICTDFSPRILRRNRAYFTHLGLEGRISLLAFDARRTPFRDGAVRSMTTNLGLPNIAQPEALVKELRRVVDGQLLAISIFYAGDDAANRAALREHGLETLAVQALALDAFHAAGWQAEVRNASTARIAPTPRGEVIPADIDSLPVSTTTVTFAVLAAR